MRSTGRSGWKEKGKDMKKKWKSWPTLVKNLKTAHMKYMDALMEYNQYVESSHALIKTGFIDIKWTGGTK